MPAPVHLVTILPSKNHDASRGSHQTNERRRRRIPRVIHNAVDGAEGEGQPQPVPGGYSPAVSIQVARAHCWARYDVVVPALRSLSNLYLLQQPARFPDGAVYLPLELPPLGPCMRRVNNELRRLEAITGDRSVTFSDKSTVTACIKFMEAVAHAALTATSVWAQNEDPDNPVLYDRVVFEERFGLTWTDDDDAP